ncbi:hypothetical protein PM082_024631 [Marasmius tenuissimus]|nr:hypothetical protein PM082_024631 [Marasmius tenuissimus]
MNGTQVRTVHIYLPSLLTLSQLGPSMRKSPLTVPGTRVQQIKGERAQDFSTMTNIRLYLSKRPIRSSHNCIHVELVYQSFPPSLMPFGHTPPLVTLSPKEFSDATN